MMISTLCFISYLFRTSQSVITRDTFRMMRNDALPDCEPIPPPCPVDDDFSMSDVTLAKVEEELINGISSCCYQYTVTHSNSMNCDNKLPNVAKFNLAYACDASFRNNTTVVRSKGIASIGDNLATCYNGIQFDQDCSGSCDYSVCLTWPSRQIGDKCCASTGWAMVKDNSFPAFTETSVPQCICPTDSPSTNPTTDHPTAQPTLYPTVDPTKFYSRVPTLEPTPSPSAYCRPVVQIWINKGCEESNLEPADTNIMYTDIRTYKTLSNVNKKGSFYDVPPSGVLSEFVMSQMCPNSYNLAQAYSVNQPNNDNGDGDDDDDATSNHDPNEKTVHRRHRKVWLETQLQGKYPMYLVVILFFIAYSICATLFATKVYISCRNSARENRRNTYMDTSEEPSVQQRSGFIL